MSLYGGESNGGYNSLYNERNATTVTQLVASQIQDTGLTGNTWVGANASKILESRTLQGTTNQINISNVGTAYTMSTPQNIDTNANVTFNGLTCNGATGATGTFTHLICETATGTTGSFANITSNTAVFQTITGDTGTINQLQFNGATGAAVSAGTVNGSTGTFYNLVYGGATGGLMRGITGSFTTIVYYGATGRSLDAHLGTINNITAESTTSGTIKLNNVPVYTSLQPYTINSDSSGNLAKQQQNTANSTWSTVVRDGSGDFGANVITCSACTGTTGSFSNVNATVGTFTNLTFSGFTGTTVNAATINGNTITGLTGSFANASITNFAQPAFTVNGGASFGWDVYVGQSLTVNDDCGITGDLIVGGTGMFTNRLTVPFTQDSSSTITGAITTAGGLGVAKNLFGATGTFTTINFQGATGTTGTFRSVIGSTGVFSGTLNAAGVSGTTGTFRSVIGSTGSYDMLNSQGVSGTTGTFRSVIGSTGVFSGTLNAAGVSGTTGTFSSVIGSTGAFATVSANGFTGSTGTFSTLIARGFTGATGTIDTIITNNVLMNNSTASYSATYLNYYEEYSASIQFTMSGNNISQTTTLKIIRIGKAVILSMTNNVNFTTTGVSSGLYAAGVIPTRFRPPSTMLVDNATRTTASGVVSTGLTRVTDLGDIFVYTNFALAGFGAASNTITPTSISYCLN